MMAKIFIFLEEKYKNFLVKKYIQLNENQSEIKDVKNYREINC